MTAVCPMGHVSGSAERCDVCGEQIADRAEPARAPTLRRLPRLPSGPPAPRPPTLRPAMLVPVKPHALARRRIRLGLGLLFVATALVVGLGAMVRGGLDDVREYVELKRDGAEAGVHVTRIEHKGLIHTTVCGFYLGSAQGRPSPGELCVSAYTRDDRSPTIGSTIRVRYQRDDPTRAIVVGANPGMVRVEAGLVVTLLLAVTGVVLLASSRRAVEGLGTRDVIWVAWTGVLGLTSWIAIGWAARTMRRWSLLPAIAACGIGAVAAWRVLSAVLGDGRLPWVWVALWLGTWVGSMVHAYLLVPAVARFWALGTERS
jgi:hypothetical protein